MLVDDLTLIKALGKSAFGGVFLTSKQDTKEKFVSKQIDKREIAILKDINHENIIKLYEVKETPNYFYLVTEYCNGGALSYHLEKYQKKYNGIFSEKLVQYLVSAVKYLHDKRIIHRNIKLDNILVHYDSEECSKDKDLLKAKVKLIDFGFARYLKKENWLIILCLIILQKP